MSPGSARDWVLQEEGETWAPSGRRFQVPHGRDGQDWARDTFGVNLWGEALGMATVNKKLVKIYDP